MAKRSRVLSFLKFILGWPISILSLIFIIRVLFPKYQTLQLNLTHINYLLLLFGILCFFGYAGIRALLWQKILKTKRYNKLSYKDSLYFWSFSELKRYTPGNLWSILGRVLSFERLGIKKEDSVKSLIIESQFLILGALVVSLLSLPLIFNVIPDFKYELFAQPLIFLTISFLIILLIFNKKFIKNKHLSSFFPNKSYSVNVGLLSISIISLLLFGIGSYLTASSLFYINPGNFLILSGFFVLALLVGYLSLITPMGLGVREGIIFLGLSYLISPLEAGIVAIFTRVIFIASEIVFLFLIWIWYKAKNKYVAKAEKFIYKNKHLIFLLTCILLYIIYFSTTAFLRHDNFYSGRFDLGNMDQTVWNTMHGRIFQLTNPNGTNITSRLSFHADFFLILLSPLYHFWRDPKMLLLIQSIILPLGAIFVFLLGNKVLKNKNLSLILAISFLLNPSVNNSNLYDFHPVVLGTTFLLGAFYFLKTNRIIPFLIFLILTGLTKEDVWIIVSLIGLYTLFFEKKRILGASLFILSGAIFCYLVLKLIPDNAGGKHFALSYYSEFGDSPISILKNALSNPLRILSIISGQDRVIYLKQILFPLALFPIFSLYFIFAIPSLLIDLLSNNSQLHSVIYQYTATITPFVFISGIYAIKKIKEFTPNLSLNFFAAVILVFSIFSAYDFGPLPGARIPNIQMYTKPLKNKDIVEKYINGISRKYSVATTNNLGAHLSHRQRIYTVPVGIGEADMILFLLRGNPKDPNVMAEKEAYLKVNVNQDYQKVFQNGEFIVFKKKPLI